MYPVCLLDIKDPLLGEREDELIAALCDARRRRVLSYKMRDDRLRALGSSLLMQDMLWSYTEGSAGKYADKASDVKNASEDTVFWNQMTVSDILGDKDTRLLASSAFCGDLVFDRTEQGKPYIRGCPLFFSVSHSGSFCACAVAESEIGLDIQKKGVLDIEKCDRISERYFDAREKIFLREARDNEERITRFFRLWTVKEAYAKFTGDGIAAVISLSPCLDADMYGIRYSFYETDEYCAALCRHKSTDKDIVREEIR